MSEPAAPGRGRAWIAGIEPDAAEGRLAELYRRIAGPGGEVDNILRVHALRPHTLEAHMALYRATLHHARNALPRSLLESLGVYVSVCNGCDYCVEHHAAGLARLVGDARAAEIRAALEARRPEGAFAGRELQACRYARALTERPAELREADVAALREAGFEDGEILEINQVCAYFAYANRTVLGLGVSTRGDVLGLSPSETADERDWGHR